MSRYHLAQLNIAMLREPLESPGMADFVANLERINALAEASPGYLWRLQDEAGDATAIRPFGAAVLVNLSLWRDVQSLSDYVYKSAHSEMLKRRREWFDKAEQAHMVLWWVPAGSSRGSTIGSLFLIETKPKSRSTSSRSGASIIAGPAKTSSRR